MSRHEKLYMRSLKMSWGYGTKVRGFMPLENFYEEVKSQSWETQNEHSFYV